MRLETVAEAALILALPARFLRTALTTGLRRKLAAFPRILGTLVVAGLACLAAVVIAARSVVAFRVLAVVCGVLVVAEAWRARPSFGRSRRLPPGSLSLAPLGPWVDGAYLAKQAARYGPIFKMSNFTQPMICIADMELGRDLLKRFDSSLSVPPLPFQRFVPGGFIRYMGPGPHRARSASLRAAFSPEVVAAGEPGVAALLGSGLARLSQAPLSRPRDVMAPFVTEGFAQLFFGVSSGSERATRLLTDLRTIDYRRALWNPSGRVRRAVASAQQNVLSQPPAGFLGAAAAVDPEATRDAGLVVNLLYVLNTASADVAGLLGWILKRLADNPEWLERLRSSADPDGLAERIVRETLRISQSEYIARSADADIEIGGYVIPRGYLVRVCIREIHRSAAAFPDPMRFDPDRFLAPPSPALYAPLGASRILCLGEGITLSFGRLFALELARGYDVCVVADGPEELGPFHWQPSGRFRVRLTPRPAAPGPRAEALRTPA